MCFPVSAPMPQRWMRGERDRNSLRLCALPSSPHFGILLGTLSLSHSVLHPTPILSPYPRLIPSIWPESSFALGSPIPFKKTSLLIGNSSLRIKRSYLLRACYAWSFTYRTHVLLKPHTALQGKEYSTLSVDETTRLAEVEYLAQATNQKAAEAGSAASAWTIWLQSLSSFPLHCALASGERASSLQLKGMVLYSAQLPPGCACLKAELP